jgi:hypothetical protein
LERLRTPSNAENHGLSCGDIGKSSSKRRHKNAKKSKSSGSISIESSNRKICSKDCPTVTLDQESLRGKGRYIQRVP